MDGQPTDLPHTQNPTPPPKTKPREAKVDRDLQLALSKGHEVLLKCELPSAGGGGGAAGGGVTYGFLAVPIAYEREVCRKFGLGCWVGRCGLCTVIC